MATFINQGNYLLLTGNIGLMVFSGFEIQDTTHPLTTNILIHKILLHRGYWMGTSVTPELYGII